MWDSLDLRSLATVNLNIGYETAGFSVKLESVLLMRYGIWILVKSPVDYYLIQWKLNIWLDDKICACVQLRPFVSRPMMHIPGDIL